MKTLALLALLFTASSAVAQGGIVDPSKKEPCYKKADKRKGQRFAEWECGKIAGVVDCNEKLELDQASNTVITSTGKSPFSGTCETCHSNGILERRVTFVNGKQNGSDTTYYASGCMMVIRTHVAGAENGRSMYFYDSLGTIAWEMNHSVGQPHGKQIYYSKKKDANGNGIQGDTTKYEFYINGLLEGQKVTFSKGKRQKVATYSKGELNGPFLVYNSEEKLIEETNYKSGKKDGVFQYYYDDGKLLSTEIWDMDARDGEFKTFFYDGSIQKIERYKKSPGGFKIQVDAVMYEVSNKEAAEAVYKMLKSGAKKKEISESLKENDAFNMTQIQRADPNESPLIQGNKLENGLNKPYKLETKFVIANVTKISSIPQNDVKEGWFEEYFPNKKMKRRALYKKNVLIEEHVFNEQGVEVKTFGAPAMSDKEDDEAPGTKKDPKKKEKEKKGKKGETPAAPEGQ